MSTIINKTPRLLAAAKEFNIGKETLVEFLTTRGFEINANNPNTKISEDMYDSLQREFALDKAVKQKSDELALPKNSANKKENAANDPKAAILVDKEKEEKAIKKAAADEAIKLAKEAVLKEEAAEKAKKLAEKEANRKALEEIAKQALKPKSTEKKEKKTVEIETKPKKEEKQTKKIEKAPVEHFKVETPKLDGPNILGKINLEELNQPKNKKEVVKKAEKKTEKPKEKETAPKKKITEEKAVEKSEITNTDSIKSPVPPIIPTPPNQAVVEDKPEHIGMKRVELGGPKILGKIELPVASDNSDNKRNRKRIPVQKKPENNRSTPNSPNTNNPSAPNNNNRPNGNSPNYRGNNNNNNRPQPVPGAEKRSDRRRAEKNSLNRSATPAGTPQEIDAKEIQRKIQETQARLAGGNRSKNQKAKYRRDKRDVMAEKRLAVENSEDGNIIQVTEFISVSELANLMDVGFTDVIGKCMGLGVMVSINQRLDAEIIELVAAEFGYEAKFINLEQEADIETEDEVEDESLMIARAPIVTIMGHVDHGKTSLLDFIRNANVVSGEAGGITQHIGAYQVKTTTGKRISFLDTPGHEAFTAMRARGARVADIAVIVIAADDAIMPQTKEAISHAQAAGLPMVFALNKMDKEGANPEKIREQLSAMNILVEEWGGKFQSQEISAKKGLNIDLLLEKILLEAELLDLKANPDKTAIGSVIEASLDKGRGYVATVLVQSGTLNQGDMIVSGQNYGRIKAMLNERGVRVEKAGPSAPVQILGLNGAPQAGEKFKVYTDENEAKEVANHRAQIIREQGIRTRKHLTLDEIGRRLALGNFKELPIIIKGDFDGSVEALSDSLQKLSTEEVAINVVHKGVGQITESDVLLASASDAIVIGFQVRPSSQASKLAEQENIEIRFYSIIYDAIDEIKSAMEGLLEPKKEKKIVCNIEVRETFKISNLGTIAGCYVLDGKMSRNTKVNIIRDGIVVFTNGDLASLKRFKDDVKDVNAGYECGLSIKNFNDIRNGDIIEGFEEVDVKRTL